MPNWTKLCVAALRDDANARRLALIERIEGWLDLALEEAVAKCDEAVADELAARELGQMIVLVNLKLQRALSLPREEAGFIARLQDLMARDQTGALSPDERRLWGRYQTLFQMRLKLQGRFPALANSAPPAGEDAEKRAALAAIQDRQNDVQRFSVPGLVSVERMEAAEAVLGDYRMLLADLATGGQLHIDICFFAGHAAYALGRGWSLLGRTERAGLRYAEASELYRQGGAPADATELAQKARALGYAVRSDVDGASAEDLRALVSGLTDPFARAQAYARLSRLATESNAIFDAADYAEKSVEAFGEAGFPDPEGRDIDTTFDAWIDTACADELAPARGKPFPLINQIASTYLALLGARLAGRVAKEPAKAAKTQAAIDAVISAINEANQRIAAAQNDVPTRLAAYAPILDDSAPAEVVVERGDAVQRHKRLGERLNAIQIEANEADAAHDKSALEALLLQTEECVNEARELGVLPMVGLAYRTDAYVRLRAGDTSGAIEAATAGEAAILAGAPATPEALAAHPEFPSLLMLRSVRGQALGVKNDLDGLLAFAAETVRAIEAQRYRISDPYQQGAFLADRTVFYVMLIISAFRLGRWDDVLSGMELLKARAALRNRLSPPPATGATDIAARLAAANEALAKAPKDSDAWRAANEQRRLVLSLSAVERRRASGEAGDAVPDLTVSAVQAALAPDEVVVSWVWVAPLVLIVLAVDKSRVQCERIVLAKDDRAALDDYLAKVRGGAIGEVEHLDGEVSRLAAAVLPLETRRFVAHARRLILSPHRALHVLPFHAATLDGRLLIEQAAIRHVPNLGSLIVPWRGASSPDGGLLSIGIDAFEVPGANWQRLKDAEAEAGAVAGVWSAHGLPTKLMIGPAASVAAFLGLGETLASYRCLHLATHGGSVFDREAANDPFATRLILQDGALDALTVSQLRLGAEVVVLSACHSGQQALSGRGLDELPGDDVFGLPAALFEAGACGVIGALWPVADAVAPILMNALHEGLAEGAPPELALQKAYLDYLRRPDASRNIFDWAPMFHTSVGRIERSAPGGA